MEASVLIRLIDQVSGPAGKMRQTLAGIGQAANELRAGAANAIRQGFSAENLETATANAEAAFARARGRLLGAVGTAMTLAAPLVQSAKFDQSFKGLEKVLDDLPIDRLKALRKFALETSTIVPIAARDVVELMAEAVQGGVPQEDIEAFALYVAKAAVAFDMAGAEIGERFAKLRNVYKLNQEGIEDIGDATNHLSNMMASKASEISDFANRAAGAATIFRLTAVETSAVGSALISAGVVPETAARGFTAMATRILKGGKDMDAAFASIGMNRKQFMADLEKDGPAALENLFTALSKSKNGMKALTEIVGSDFVDDFAKILGNPELLAEAFDLVADKAAYAGSATNEAAKQAEGALKRWDLLVNRLTRVAVVLGDQLLPVALDAADGLGSLVDKVAAFADANPELASALVKGAAGLMAFSIASRLIAFGFAGLRLGLLPLVGLFLKFNAEGRTIALGWRIIAGAAGFLRTALGPLGLAIARLGIGRLLILANAARVLFDVLRNSGSIGEFVKNLSELGLVEWASIAAGLLMLVSPMATLAIQAAGLARALGLIKGAGGVAGALTGAGATAAGGTAASGGAAAAGGGLLAGLTRLAPVVAKASGYAPMLYSAWKLGQGIQETGQIATGKYYTTKDAGALQGMHEELDALKQQLATERETNKFGATHMAQENLTYKIALLEDRIKWSEKAQPPASPAAKNLLSGMDAALAGMRAPAPGGPVAPRTTPNAAAEAAARIGREVDQAGSQAADQLTRGGEQGGAAVEKGGQAAAAAMTSAAAAIQSAAGQLGAAVARAGAIANQRSAGVGAAIQAAKGGALHGGTE